MDLAPTLLQEKGMVVPVAKCCRANVDSPFLLDENRVPQSGHVVRGFDLEPRCFGVVQTYLAELAGGGYMPCFGVNIKDSHCDSAA